MANRVEPPVPDEVDVEVARMEAEGAPAPRVEEDEGDALEAPADNGQSD